MTTAKRILEGPTLMQATESDPGLRYQRREDRTMLLLMTPALLVIVVLLVVPLAWLSWQSIYHDGFTLENYRRMFTGAYLDTFLLTFKLSIIVTVITLLLGYPVAYFAASLPPKLSALVLGMVILPFWTSVLVRTYAWLVLLQRTTCRFSSPTTSSARSSRWCTSCCRSWSCLSIRRCRKSPRISRRRARASAARRCMCSCACSCRCR
jgi:ABC-type Fe3+ transport system permease subunit